MWDISTVQQHNYIVVRTTVESGTRVHSEHRESNRTVLCFSHYTNAATLFLTLNTQQLFRVSPVGIDPEL